MEQYEHENGTAFVFGCGATVVVGSHLVGFEGGHPSNVDYYYDEGHGYGCATREEVAAQYHQNFCECIVAVCLGCGNVGSRVARCCGEMVLFESEALDVLDETADEHGFDRLELLRFAAYTIKHPSREVVTASIARVARRASLPSG